MRTLLIFLLALTATPALMAQARPSPYIPLDHPLLPLAEYLIARGDIVDPSPMYRPFRRSDLLHAIEQAALDPASPSGRVAERLTRAFADPEETNWVRGEIRGGIDAFSQGRRDLLHPAGDGGARFYAEAPIQGRFGPVVIASRPAAENRLKVDPDWTGGALQNRKNQAYRFVEGYLSAQFERARLHFGQMSRNWGPVGSLGLSIADYAYPRTELGFDLMFRDFQFNVVATQLNGMESISGAQHKRYFLAHRLNVRLTKRLNLALWETGILASEDQSFDPTFRNPFVMLSFPIQQGLPDTRNTIIGGDMAWRPVDALLLEGQVMIDDRWRLRDDPDGTGEPKHPGRWAMTGAATLAIGSSASLRTHFSVINSLAYRTIDSTQSFLDRGLGIGPNFPDQLTVGASLAFPVMEQWLVRPDVTILKQGEGRITTPFPTNAELPNTPELFLGQPATTVRLGATVSGGVGILQLSGTGGYFMTKNADHIRGLDRNRFEARIRATIGISHQGPVR